MSVSSWEPDPTGRHQYRWWDGEEWTDQVADDGVQTVDPISSSEARLPQEVPPSTLPPAPSSVPANVESDLDTAQPELSSMLASKGRRLGAFLLEPVLVAVTLVIGWLIWSLIVYSRGQTPAKQVLGMRVIRLEGHQTASWGWMALRELVLKMIPSFVVLGLLWVIANGIVLLINDRNQTVWDMILKTAVVHDR